MLINYLVLGTAGWIALIRPLYGIGLLLLLEESIFFLGSKYAFVDLPIGHASPMDILPICILVGAFIRSRRARTACLRMPTPRFAVRPLLCQAVVPYVAWTAACSVVGLALGASEASFTVALRNVLITLAPWTLVPAVWLLRDESRAILRLMLVTAVITALVHLVITVFDIRSVMMTAYYEGDMLAPVSRWRATQMLRSGVPRSWPQGTPLIIFSFVFLSARMIVNSARTKTADIAFAAILLCSLTVTVTRSFLGLSAIGVLISLLLAHSTGLLTARLLVRSSVVILVVGTLGAGVVLLRSDYADFWLERLNKFSEDGRIFSPDNERGLNNLGALAAIEDRPILGYGVHDYPDRFARGSSGAVGGYHNDIHPLLGVCLSGGVFALVLFLRLHWLILSRCIRAHRSQRSLARHTLPYVTLVALNLVTNSVGAGGTTEGRGLAVAALFFGLLGAEIAHTLQLGRLAYVGGLTPRTAGEV
jgi:O-antigen ligase